MGLSLNLERALRMAATCHQGQTRRVSGVPYVEHTLAVALILDRLRFPEHVVIAGLLHDIVEDTDTPLAEIEQAFGRDVASIVSQCSEVKLDENGRMRPWADRKRDHLAAYRSASVDARAVALADKYHNLLSVLLDLSEGREVWSHFHADRAQVLWYYRSVIEVLGQGNQRLEDLAAEATQLLKRVEEADGSA